MDRIRGHKARLYPTPEQAVKLWEQGHAARAMWNALHSWWTMASENRWVTTRDADQAIKQARKDVDWLGVLPAQASQQVLRAYFRAWQGCWAGRSGPPKFKVRSREKLSIDLPQAQHMRLRRINRRWGVLHASMIGKIRFRWTKDLPIGKGSDTGNRVSGARLVKDANGWHVAFRVHNEVDTPRPHPGSGIGVDLGVTKPLALSDGTFREHGPWLSPKEAQRLKRLERKGARQRRQSPRGEPTSQRLRHTYDRIAAVRAKAKRRALDWQHKVTVGLAEEFGVVGVEDLQVSAMTTSARGTREAPGANVKQKSGLNRAIVGEAWARTVTLLAYKLSDRGGHLVRVPTPNTSRRCSRCRVINDGNRESQKRFVCKAPDCGFTANADTNAACNVEYATQQQAPQDIVGARTWSPRRRAG